MYGRFVNGVIGLAKSEDDSNFCIGEVEQFMLTAEISIKAVKLLS